MAQAVAAPAGERARLAHVAVEAALGTPGVVEANAGPGGLHATFAGGERVPGVRVTSAGAERYSVELFLTTAVVPLAPLADDVRTRVRRAARSAGLETALDGVAVTILDVATP
jgi:hypothetical protein